MPLAFEIVTDEQGFRSLEPAWRELFGRLRRRDLFLSFDWTWRIWEHLARIRPQQLFLVVGRSVQRVVLIWPLVRNRRPLWRTAEWIGSEHSYYNDVLVDDVPEAAEWLEAAWRFTAGHFDVLWLSHVREYAVLAPFLRRAKGVRENVEAAPYVDWSDWPDWETYWRARTRNLKRDLDRRRRRLEEQGRVEFRLVASVDEAAETLDWMLDLKAEWMRSRGLRVQNSGVDAPEMRAFYKACAADACAKRGLCLGRLTLDGKVLAGLLAFRFEGTLRAILAVYDPEWEKFAPGKLLLADILRWSLENGGTICDLMPTGEAYKYLWATRDARVTTYLVPCSVRGRALVAWRRSRLGAALRSVARLRPKDLPRILRNRLRRRSTKPAQG